MTQDADESRLVELDESTCRQLLASHDVGRVAVNAEPSPEVLPVTYALREGHVVFRTSEGSKLAAAEQSQAATFEVDGARADAHSAWSVIVRGALEIANPDSYDDLPEPLAGGDRPFLVRLVVDEITGRRIPATEGWGRAMVERGWQDRDASDLMG